MSHRCTLQATLLNPDMWNPYFHLNRPDWKVPESLLIHIIYIRIIRILPNPDRNLGFTSVRIKSCLYQGFDFGVYYKERVWIDCDLRRLRVFAGLIRPKSLVRDDMTMIKLLMKRLARKPSLFSPLPQVRIRLDTVTFPGFFHH